MWEERKQANQQTSHCSHESLLIEPEHGTVCYRTMNKLMIIQKLITQWWAIAANRPYLALWNRNSWPNKSVWIPRESVFSNSWAMTLKIMYSKKPIIFRSAALACSEAEKKIFVLLNCTCNLSSNFHPTEERWWSQLGADQDPVTHQHLYFLFFLGPSTLPSSSSFR